MNGWIYTLMAPLPRSARLLRKGRSRQAGFKFEVLYRDNDLVKARFAAWNGEFGGSADVYLDTGQLGDIATQLHGFPRDVSDNRELLF